MLEGALLDGHGSGIKELLRDHFFVVGLEEFNNPLPDAFVGGILELDIELDIPLDVEAIIGSPPLSTNLPFGLAREEIEKRSFRLGDYDREELTVLGLAGFLDLLGIEEGIQLVLYVLDCHLFRFRADFAWANYHSKIMVAKTVVKVKQGVMGQFNFYYIVTEISRQG